MSSAGIAASSLSPWLAAYRQGGMAHAPAQASDASGASPSASASAVLARAVDKESGAIQIQTAEGDTVSIRFRSLSSVTLAAAQSTSSAGTDSAARVTVLSRGKLQVEVDGNLNADELAAIGDLLDQVDTLATQFFDGDVQAAFDAASHIGFDSAQIAGFSVDLTYSHKLTAALASAGSSAPAAPAANDGTLPPPADAPAEDPAPVQAASTSDAPAQNAPAGDPAPASIRETILDFVHDVLAKLATVHGTSQVNFSMSWKLGFFAQALASIAPPVDAGKPPADSAGNTAGSPAGASPGTRLLGDTLQRLAS